LKGKIRKDAVFFISVPFRAIATDSIAKIQMNK